MKIENDKTLSSMNSYKNDAVVRSDEGGRNGEVGRSGEVERSGVGDRVEISVSREDIARIANEGSLATEARSRKIALLKEQVSQGSYRVDAELVAKKIVEKLQGLSTPHQSAVKVE